MSEKSSIEFHPAAREAIDKGANDLLRELVEHAIKPTPPPAFPSERPVVAHITDKEMVEEPSFFENDIFRNIIARYFPRDGKVYGLAGEAHHRLRRLTDQVLKTRWVSQSVGRPYVEDKLFRWCRDNFTTDNPQPFTKYLQHQVRNELRLVPVWVPVAFMEVENTNSNLILPNFHQ